MVEFLRRVYKMIAVLVSGRSNKCSEDICSSCNRAEPAVPLMRKFLTNPAVDERSTGRTSGTMYKWISSHRVHERLKLDQQIEEHTIGDDDGPKRLDVTSSKTLKNASTDNHIIT